METHKGIHKKFKIRVDKYLKNSPFDQLKYFIKSKIFLNKTDYEQNFINLKLSNDIINIEFEDRFKDFDIDEYYNVRNQNNKLVFANTSFLNTQAICHFSLLNYLGFKKVFFLGMDMNFMEILNIVILIYLGQKCILTSSFFLLESR